MSSNSSSSQSTNQDSALTPELVKEVTDRVMALLKEDLRIQNERSRPGTRTMPRKRWGGR